MPDGINESVDIARALVKIDNLMEDIREMKEQVRDLVRQGDITKLNDTVNVLQKQVDALSSWQNKILGGFAVVSVIFTIALALA